MSVTNLVLNERVYTGIATPASAYEDNSRWHNNGTHSNVTWVRLPSGLFVRDFNGATSYCEIPDSPSMRFTRGGFIYGWIYPRTLGAASSGRIIEKSTATTAYDGYAFYVSTGNILRVLVDHDSATESSGNSVVMNSWQFVVAHINTVARKLYIGNKNGFTDVTSVVGAVTSPPNVGALARVGTATLNRTFDGYIVMLRMSVTTTVNQLYKVFQSERKYFAI
jgi:hypothetical protein